MSKRNPVSGYSAIAPRTSRPRNRVSAIIFAPQPELVKETRFLAYARSPPGPQDQETGFLG
ncbi:MAG: hypothetical protein AB4352_27395 [Hormoscilla sp.]